MDVKAEAVKLMWALIRLMKTQKAVAKALGQSKQTFNYWLNHANKIPHDQLLAMKKLLKKELERGGKITFEADKDAPLDTELLANSALTISHRVELAMFYEELFGIRQGQRSDIKNPSKERRFLPNFDEVSPEQRFNIGALLHSPKRLGANYEQTIQKNHKLIRRTIEEIGVHSDKFPTFETLLRQNFDEVPLKISLTEDISDQKRRNKFAGRTDEVVAKLVGFNNRETFRSAKKVVQSGTPELIKAMDSERISIHQACQLTSLPAETQKILAQKNKKEIANYFKELKKHQGQTQTPCSAMRVIDLAIYQQNSLLIAEEKYQLPLRFVFVSLIACCDECGGFSWKPSELKALILPYTDLDFSKLLEALLLSGFIQKDESNGQVYGRIPLAKKYIYEVNHATLVT